MLAVSRSTVETSRQGPGGVVESESSVSDLISSNPLAQTKQTQTFSTQFTHEDTTTPQSAMSTAVGSSTRPDGAPPQPDTSAQSGDAGVNPPRGSSVDPAPEVQDPLAHMSEIDKFGLKGFSFLMNNYPDYTSLVAGSDVTTLGFDLNSPE